VSKAPITASAFAVAIALVATGCGGGSSSASTSSLTKADFIQQGDRICKTGSEEIVKGFRETKAGVDRMEPSEAEAAEISEGLFLPVVRKEAEELRALGVPSGGGGEITTILDEMDSAIEEAEEDPGALLRPESEDFFGPVEELMAGYGFTVCGA
jgi:hypothetical protein